MTLVGAKKLLPVRGLCTKETKCLLNHIIQECKEVVIHRSNGEQILETQTEQGQEGRIKLFCEMLKEPTVIVRDTVGKSLMDQKQTGGRGKGTPRT